jgi:membrane protease YdiL (CAAX protease family)
MMTATYPLAGATSERPHAAVATERRAWGFWSTSGWFLLSIVAFMAASFAVGFFYAIGWVIAYPNVPIDINSAVLGNLVTAISVPAAALLLMLLSRKRGWSMREYLGLTMPRMRHVLMGLGALVAFWGLVGLAVYFYPAIDQSEVMKSEYRAALGSGASLALFWLVLVGTAPVAEEIIFRGFLMRGWAASRIGAVGALLLSSAIFAAIHLQYTVLGMGVVLGLGLLFGIARLWSGSTTLSIIMHATWNLAVGVAIMLIA